MSIYKRLMFSDARNAVTFKNGNPAIFMSRTEPKGFGKSDKTISVYLSGVTNFATEIASRIYTINCRAQTEAEAYAIADKVIEALNRVVTGEENYSCKLHPVVPAENESDSYRVPVEVRSFNKQEG